MSKDHVVILGSNGHIGHAVAKAFVAAGWTVTGMARTQKLPVAGMRFVSGDAESVDAMRRAIGDAPIVVHALNLPYHTWYGGRLEAQMANVLAAVGREGRTVLFPGNIYNFAAAEAVLTPETPAHPQTPRGAIRVRVEAMLREAAGRGDLQAIVLRAGDFYGPGSSGDWFDQVMLRRLAKGRVSVIGTPGIGHSWAYLPDLARAFEMLAALRRTLGAYEHFHFPGHFVTPEAMGRAIAAAVPGGVKVSRFPLWLLRAAGLADPVIREVARMDYIWRHPLELRDARFAALVGEGFDTPFEAAVARTVIPVLQRGGGMAAAAQGEAATPGI